MVEYTVYGHHPGALAYEGAERLGRFGWRTYVPSGRYTSSAIGWAVLYGIAAIIGGELLHWGATWAALTVQSRWPFVAAAISLLAICTMGCLIGNAVGRGLVRGHARSPSLAITLAVGCVLLARVYSGLFAYGTAAYLGISSPGDSYSVWYARMADLFANTGQAFWTMETIVMAIFASIWAWRPVRAPFCEQCHTWMRWYRLGHRYVSIPEVKRAAREHDTSVVLAGGTGMAPMDETAYYFASDCPDCEVAFVTILRSGGKQAKAPSDQPWMSWRRPIVRHLEVGPSTIQQLIRELQ